MLLRIRGSLLTTLAGAVVCSVSYTAAPPASAGVALARGHSWISMSAMRESKSTGLLFVADTNNNVVDIFSLKKPTSPIGQIKGNLSLPEALAVDKSGNLYVYNSRTNAIFEFAPPYAHGLVRTFNDGLTGVLGLTVDTKGTVYAANDLSYQVVKFLRGSSHGTIINLPVDPTGIALNSAGDLVCAFNQYGAAGVLVLTDASRIPKNLLIPLENGTSDVLFDAKGDLVVEDTSGTYIKVFPPGARKPSVTIDAGFVSPLHMAFSADKQVLYVADYANGSGSSSIKAISYPAGKVQWKLTGFSASDSIGVAVSPAAVP